MYTVKNIEQIGKILVERGQTLAVAESVTAGNLQAALSLADNAISFFQGGITTYNLGQKARHLQIDPIHAQNCNCVSSKIASGMATHVTKLFASDWGIAITGYAAPVPEFDITELFAYCAFSFKGQIIHAERLEAKKGEMRSVQQYYVVRLIDIFLTLI